MLTQERNVDLMLRPLTLNLMALVEACIYTRKSIAEILDIEIKNPGEEIQA